MKNSIGCFGNIMGALGLAISLFVMVGAPREHKMACGAPVVAFAIIFAGGLIAAAIERSKQE